MALMVVLLGVFSASAEDKKPEVDRLDPAAVAKAFAIALANGRMDEAVEFVILEDREDFRNELAIGVPELPKKPEVVVRFEKDRKRAGVNIANAKPRANGRPPIGFNMELVDGKWWVVK